jgi:type II secretory pathway predicted ATPase ExeA
MSEPLPDRLTDAQRAAVAKLACGCEQAGGVALLCGPGGVGKTTVLADLAAAIGARRSVGLGDAAHWGEAAALPEVVLVDDAHQADEATLGRLLQRCRDRRPAACLVLAGEGRLFTLMTRDTRLEQAVRIRVALPTFTAAETRRLLEATLASVVGRPVAVQDTSARTVHEIAAGTPAAVIRLAELAGVLAASRPDGGLSVDDVEAIHGRLSPAAA